MDEESPIIDTKDIKNSKESNLKKMLNKLKDSTQSNLHNINANENQNNYINDFIDNFNNMSINKDIQKNKGDENDNTFNQGYIEKFENDTKHNKILSIEKHKKTKSLKVESTAIVSSRNSYSSNENGNEKITFGKEIRNKNLEIMLRKLQVEQNAIDNSIFNNDFNNSVDILSKTFHKDNPYFCANPNESFVSVKSARTCGPDNKAAQNNLLANDKSILSIFRKNDKGKEPPKTEKIFTKTMDTVIKPIFNYNTNKTNKNLQNTARLFTSKNYSFFEYNNNINNFTRNKTKGIEQKEMNYDTIDEYDDNINNNEIQKSAKEAKKVVKLVDQKVKQLKLKFLRDTYINLDKLSKYSNTFDTIITQLTNNDIRNLYFSCRHLHEYIKEYFTNKTKEHIINKFIAVYKELFDIIESKLCFTYFKKTFNVSLEMQLKINFRNKFPHSTIELENVSSFLTKDSEMILKQNQPPLFRNVYKFDYNPDSSSHSIWWAIKEETFYNFDENENKTYTMPIIPTVNYDKIIISITLLNNYGLLNFNSFKWRKLRSIKITGIDYFNYDFSKEKRVKDQQIVDYDLSRFCEMELVKSAWKNLEKLKDEEIKKKIMYYSNKLRGFFNINKIEFDNIGFFIFKVHCKAILQGYINERDIGINISIRNKGEPCCNEVRKNGFLCELGKGLEIRIDDRIVFYFSMSKERPEEEEED